MQFDGDTIEERMQQMREWHAQQLVKHGWYTHMTFPEDGGTYWNIHTHGMSENFNHPDLQLVIGLPEHTTNGILHNFADRIKAGEKFKAGDRVSKIVGKYDVLLVEREECGRKVLRIILPDPKGCLDEQQMTPLFAGQFTA